MMIMMPWTTRPSSEYEPMIKVYKIIESVTHIIQLLVVVGAARASYIVFGSDSSKSTIFGIYIA